MSQFLKVINSVTISINRVGILPEMYYPIEKRIGSPETNINR